MHGIYCAKGTSILLGTARGDQGGGLGAVGLLLSPLHVLACLCLAAANLAKTRGGETRTELLPGREI